MFEQGRLGRQLEAYKKLRTKQAIVSEDFLQNDLISTIIYFDRPLVFKGTKYSYGDGRLNRLAEAVSLGWVDQEDQSHMQTILDLAQANRKEGEIISPKFSELSVLITSLNSEMLEYWMSQPYFNNWLAAITKKQWTRLVDGFPYGEFWESVNFRVIAILIKHQLVPVKLRLKYYYDHRSLLQILKGETGSGGGPAWLDEAIKTYSSPDYKYRGDRH